MSLSETLISSGIMMAIAGSLFTLVEPAQRTFNGQLEAADALQRLRVGVETLSRDLRMADAVLPGESGGIEIRLASPEAEGTITRHYLLRPDASSGPFQLVRRDGSESADVPVLDRVVMLQFEYLCEAAFRVRVTLGIADRQIRFDVVPRNPRAGDPACSLPP